MTKVFLAYIVVLTTMAADGLSDKINYLGSNGQHWRGRNGSRVGATLSYATLLGGSGNDHAAAVATDTEGNIYIAGNTTSLDFPVTLVPFQSTLSGNTEVFIAKFNSLGALIYCTYLGGSFTQSAKAIAVDLSGNAYVTGSTRSNDFPTTEGALLRSSTYAPAPGSSSAFVTKLNDAGNALVYSTLLGSGSPSDTGTAIYVDTDGNAYIVGTNLSPEFTTSVGALSPATVSGRFLAKLSPDGSRYLYSTGLLYSGDNPTAVAIDSAGNAYVAGSTSDVTPRPTALQPAPATRYFFSTADSGADWQLVGPESGLAIIRTAAVDPQNGSIIYAGGPDGLFKTVDGGANWSNVFSEPVALQIKIDPGDSNHLIVLTPGVVFKGSRAIYTSRDGGSTWTAQGDQDILNVVFDPLQPQNVYGTGSASFSYSRDGGDSWHRSVAVPANAVNWGAAVVDPSNSSVIYAATSAGLLKSANAGFTWTLLARGYGISNVAVDPADSQVLYATSADYLLKSIDGGQTFQYGPVSGGTDLTFDPFDQTKLYVLSSAGIDQSTDGGTTLHSISAQPLNPSVTSLSFDLQHPGTFYGVSAAAPDAFVTKVAPDGSTALFSTYFGGAGSDVANSIALDSTGNIYIAGTTSSADLPGAITGYNGNSDGFVAKLTNDGVSLAYSTFVGGSSFDTAGGVAVDASSNPVVVGLTVSTDLPLTPDATQRSGPGVSSTGYYVRLDPNGLPQSVSYLGGSQRDFATAVAFTASDQACIVGDTYSRDFPTTPDAVQSTNNGLTNTFLAIIGVHP
ncbi:MAG TPA: SBBP repeat-containing protein [Bryobacteraceae bacterium]|nr:SBBP repeat-containing protein [Bryobacteraceae bacterium]